MFAAIPFPDISPEIFSIEIGSFTFALRWYALAYIAGLLIAWRIVIMLVKRPALWRENQPPMTPQQPEDLLTWIILGVVFGGRLGYVAFYKPLYYLQNPAEILQVWQGGMSFHGGLIGVILAIYFFSRKHGLNKWSVGDAVSTGAPWGLFLGRVANFINGELWGRPTDAPWGVIFPGEAAQSCGQAIGELCARHPSQLYEAVLEGLILGIALLYLALRRDWLKYPGAIFGLLVAGYGAARFMIEFVRQPDAHFIAPGNPLGLAWEIGGYGLTMGQLLSLPMILIGLFLIWRSKRI